MFFKKAFSIRMKCEHFMHYEPYVNARLCFARAVLQPWSNLINNKASDWYAWLYFENLIEENWLYLIGIVFDSILLVSAKSL